ncbi:hypothetical protein F2Q68_00030349 [Brassica cretica]|uniref:Uncharacterized protein n=1 Tax=Brassica cretica TaxID=69181 RepID=A0A8S9GES1_BRACR|nr:hypothetical protein F2Q68_00030349 [Brassica cretica]
MDSKMISPWTLFQTQYRALLCLVVQQGCFTCLSLGGSCEFFGRRLSSKGM